MSMCSDRYAEETPLGFSKYQFPPTSSDASKQVCGTPKSVRALHAVSPLTPAPMTHVRGSSLMHMMLEPWLRGQSSPRARYTPVPVGFVVLWHAFRSPHACDL